jgi:hypothetical protein
VEVEIVTAVPTPTPEEPGFKALFLFNKHFLFTKEPVLRK